MSLPVVLRVMKRSCGVGPMLAYAMASMIEKHDPNTSRKRLEVSILLALVDKEFGFCMLARAPLMYVHTLVPLGPAGLPGTVSEHDGY